jgi:hypothetical protein
VPSDCLKDETRKISTGMIAHVISPTVSPITLTVVEPKYRNLEEYFAALYKAVMGKRTMYARLWLVMINLTEFGL